jgi:SAM-dependent methyltransferase
MTEQPYDFATMNSPAGSPRRRAAVAGFFDRLAPERRRWLATNAYYYEQDLAYMQFLIPSGLDVLEIGCGAGQLLAGLRPARGVGIDISEKMIEEARKQYPALEFIRGDAEMSGVLSSVTGKFDVIVLSDTIGYLDDIQGIFRACAPLLRPDSRVIVSYYSRLWEPILRLASRIGLRMPSLELNWLSTRDIVSLISLGDLDPIRQEARQLVPRRLLGLGTLINRYIAPLPLIRLLCLRSYVVARPVRPAVLPERLPSVSILVPCRNERGNVEAAVTRTPRFAPELELIFIEGNSQDGTYEECLRVRDAYPDRRIVVLKQDGKGKGDAMRKGYANATGEILIILDADLTVPPETMPKFYEILASRRGEFVNGTRLIYPSEDKAMRFLNAIANRGFARIFSYLLNQKLTDTLCGTKAFWAKDYRRIAAGRGYFGDFDPFGDFDLILGAAKLNLKIVELPIRYGARAYGEPQISRFRDGWLLLRMSLFAWRKLKAW